MRQIIKKEILELFLNPRYLAAFLVSATLVIISIFIGFAAYQQDMEDAVAAEKYSLQEAEKTESYKRITLKVIRRPSRFSIFNAGIANSIGRSAELSNNDDTPPQIKDSRNEESPLYAMVTHLDLTKTVVFVLSLFAILFSHSMISGEREAGTLKLIAANPVKRTSIFLGKAIGGSIPLLFLLIVPALFGILLISILGEISFSSGDWIRIWLMLLLYSLFLVTTFLAGLALSSLTRNSFMSLLACLVFWVVTVAIVPRLGVHAAHITHPTMSPVNLQKQIRETYTEETKEMYRSIVAELNSRNVQMSDFNKHIGEVWSKQEAEANRRRLDKNIAYYNEFYRKRDRMMQGAMNYSRLSPAASLQHSINTISSNGPDLLKHFEADLKNYNTALGAYSKEMVELHADEEKDKLDGRYNMRIQTNEQGFMKISSTSGLDRGRVDLSGIPEMQSSLPSLSEAFGEAQIDFLLLFAYSLIFFVIGYVAFMRYDVR